MIETPHSTRNAISEYQKTTEKGPNACTASFADVMETPQIEPRTSKKTSASPIAAD